MLPNLLTLARIFVIPIIVACFYIEGSCAKWVATCIYIFACITDFFDGYLARQWHQVSDFGRFFDPVADKLLVSIVLLMLAGNGVVRGIHLIAAAIILAREILVSGLRSYLAQIQQIIPVTKFAKWKTTTQMVSITLLIAYHASQNSLIGVIGVFFLWLASLFTVMTGYRYLKKGFLLIKF